MIAEALGEQGGNGLCGGGCDVCSATSESVATVDATRHAVTLVRFEKMSLLVKGRRAKRQTASVREVVALHICPRRRNGFEMEGREFSAVGGDFRAAGVRKSTCSSSTTTAHMLIRANHHLPD